MTALHIGQLYWEASGRRRYEERLQGGIDETLKKPNTIEDK